MGTFAHEGDVVLDLMIGTQAMWKSCKELHRQYVRIEVDVDCHALSLVGEEILPLDMAECYHGHVHKAWKEKMAYRIGGG